MPGTTPTQFGKKEMLKTWLQIWDEIAGDQKSSKSPKSESKSFTKDSQNEFFDFLDLHRKWSLVVGEKLSQHTAPVKIFRSKLIIASSHSAYSEQLSFFERDLLEKIFQQFPSLKGKVTRINFIVSPRAVQSRPVKSETPKIKKEASTTYHPFDPQVISAKKEAEAMFADIEDSEIKELLSSLKIQHTLSKK